MEPERMTQHLQALEGRLVGLSLSDGSRLDDCQLVSAGHHGVHTLWLYVNGRDLFVPTTEVLDCWEIRYHGVGRFA